MTARLHFFRFGSPQRSFQDEFASGMGCLKKNKERQASRHFRHAVAKSPRIAIDIAEACLQTSHPKLAIKVIDQYARTPQPSVNLQLETHASSTCAAAHHTLSHDHAGKFQFEHNRKELSCLEAVTRESTRSGFNGLVRHSHALAERYCHLKFGVCFDLLRPDHLAKTTGRDDAELFGRMMNMATFRLANGDSNALDIIETLFDKGPSGDRIPPVESALFRIRSSLTDFISSASGQELQRAQAILAALRGSRELFVR